MDLSRPIDHTQVRGHIFGFFLALVLQKELVDRCRTASVMVEGNDLIRGCDRLQQAAIENDCKRISTRIPV